MAMTTSPQNKRLVKLTIRGSEFILDLDSINGNVTSRLETILCEQEASSDNHLSLNRNPTIFHCIADYNVTGKLHLPEGVCGQQLKEELEFWGVDVTSVSACCALKLSTAEETTRGVTRLSQKTGSGHHVVCGSRGWREAVWSTLERPTSSSMGRVSTF